MFNFQGYGPVLQFYWALMGSIWKSEGELFFEQILIRRDLEKFATCSTPRVQK